MNKENKTEARKLVESDAKTLARHLIGEFSGRVDVVGPDSNEWPSGDGEGMLSNVTIGHRDDLTKRSAREAAEMWRKAVRRYPKAMFYPHLLGFDQDPRELWEIPEAARYIRWWARFAGIDSEETACRLLGQDSPNGTTFYGAATLVMLSGCGVFGDELKQVVLAQHKATTAQ
jgi:hypothetical protein